MMFDLAPGTQLLTRLLLVGTSLRILHEHERGVVFRLGRIWKVRAIGLLGGLTAGHRPARKG